jgi:transposase
MVLLAADGVSNTEIAELVGVSRPTVIAWRDRYVSSGMQGLHDEQRSGRPRTVDRGEILAATLTPPPARLGITHWSSRLLAGFLKVDASTVLRTWRHYRVYVWEAADTIPACWPQHPHWCTRSRFWPINAAVPVTPSPATP